MKTPNSPEDAEMPRVICVAILLLTAGSPLVQSRTGTAVTGTQNELVNLAQRRFAAFFEGDKAAYERLVAKDAVFVYSNGRTLNYAEAVGELTPLAKAGTYSFHYEDVKFRNFGDSALLVYRLVFRGESSAGTETERDVASKTAGSRR